MMRILASALIPLLAGAALAGATPQGHPHFDDGGALSWHKTLADAKAAAKKADKLIFIEYGRAA
ncbi:MAG: hypothetical protein ABIP94_05880 [Planctomycetota bacterium]